MKITEPISYKSTEYMFSHAKVAPPKIKMHMHQMYEMLWLMHGDASYMIENTTYRLNEGDIIFTRPNEMHAIIFHSDEYYERSFLQFSPQFANFLNTSLTKVFDHLPKGGNIISAETAEKFGLYRYFEEIAEYTLEKPSFWRAAVHAKLTLLMIDLNTVFKTEISPPPIKENDRIEKVAEYLTEHTDATLDELSALFFINKYHLCHAFKDRYGLTIKEFINMRRIMRAKQLIHEGHRITELCYQCGFNDYTTFYKTLKKLTGKTPSDFFKAIKPDN